MMGKKDLYVINVRILTRTCFVSRNKTACPLFTVWKEIHFTCSFDFNGWDLQFECLALLCDMDTVLWTLYTWSLVN